MQVLVYVSRFVNNKVWIQNQQVEIGPSYAGTVSTCIVQMSAQEVHTSDMILVPERIHRSMIGLSSEREIDLREKRSMINALSRKQMCHIIAGANGKFFGLAISYFFNSCLDIFKTRIKTFKIIRNRKTHQNMQLQNKGP